MGLKVSKTKLAEVFGVSVVAIDGWIRRGVPFVERPDRGGAWKFDTADVAAWLQERAAELAAAPGRVVADGELDLNAERARLAKEQADGQELKNAVTRGVLVDADEVAGGWVALATAIRTRMLSVPVRTSHELAEATEPGQCRAIVDNAIREILTELADAKIVEPKAPKRRKGANADA